MTMRFLVFGGAGQLGSELHAITRLNALDLLALGKSQADITSPEAVRQALQREVPDVVVNAAAYTMVDKAEEERDAAWDVNCRGAGIVAAACDTAQIPLIHVSTDYVFDGAKRLPYTEADATGPLSVYGASKEAGERAVRDGCRRHLILRTGWVYGRHRTNFLKTMLKLALERSSLRVVADQFGNPTDTEDLANAILVAGARVMRCDGLWGTYHFAGREPASRYEFAVEIVRAQARRTGKQPDVVAVSTAEYPTTAKRPPHATLDSTRFHSTFGVRGAPWQERVPPIVEAVLDSFQGSPPG